LMSSALQLAFTPPEIAQLLENVFGHGRCDCCVAVCQTEVGSWTAVANVTKWRPRAVFRWNAWPASARITLCRKCWPSPDRILTFLEVHPYNLHPALATDCAAAARKVDNNAALRHSNLFITEIGEQRWLVPLPSSVSGVSHAFAARPPASIKQLYARQAGTESSYIPKVCRRILRLICNLRRRSTGAVVGWSGEGDTTAPALDRLPPALVKVRPRC
jgi:hypothetical protein